MRHSAVSIKLYRFALAVAPRWLLLIVLLAIPVSAISLLYLENILQSYMAL